MDLIYYYKIYSYYHRFKFPKNNMWSWWTAVKTKEHPHTYTHWAPKSSSQFYVYTCLPKNNVYLVVVQYPLAVANRIVSPVWCFHWWAACVLSHLSSFFVVNANADVAVFMRVFSVTAHHTEATVWLQCHSWNNIPSVRLFLQSKGMSVFINGGTPQF